MGDEYTGRKDFWDVEGKDEWTFKAVYFWEMVYGLGFLWVSATYRYPFLGIILLLSCCLETDYS